MIPDERGGHLAWLTCLTGVEVFKGLYLSWKSLIQSSEEDEVREDDEGVDDVKDEELLIVCFLFQNLGFLSLIEGSLTENLALFIENPIS